MNISIPILLYHQVTPNLHPDFFAYSVSPTTFKIHMKILKVLGFNSINLDQLENYRNGKTTLPRKPILITFDDCFQESVDYAVPILKAYGFTSVFFVPTECIGGKSHWLMPELGIEFPIIDWRTVKFLDSNGFKIGSHTMSHPYLSKMSPDDCFKELDGSRKVLEDYLGHEIVHLAYPYGDFNKSVSSIAAEAGYRSACSCIEGFATAEDDPLVLPRIYIIGQENLLDLIIKLHTGRRWQTPRKLRLYAYSRLRGLKRLFNRILSK